MNRIPVISITDENEIAILKDYEEAVQEAQMLAPPNDPFCPFLDKHQDVVRRHTALMEKYQKANNLPIWPRLLPSAIIPLNKEDTGSGPSVPAEAKASEPQTADSFIPAVAESAVPTTIAPVSPVSMAVGSVYPSDTGMIFAQQVTPQLCTYTKARRPISPSDMELKEELLKKVQLKRIQETVYGFNGRYYYRLTTNDLETLIHDNLRASLSIAGNAHQIRDVMKMITTEARIIANKLEDFHGLINVGNGVYDIFSDTLTPHTPELFFTSIIDVPWIPGAECPTFDGYLHTVTSGNPAMTDRFWQAIGYALIPDNRGKRFLYLHGVSQSGKTVLCDVLASFFPEDAVSSVSVFDLGRNFGYAGLVGKLLNICSELPNGFLNDEAAGKIKAITGGDSVEVNEKYKSQYKARLDCKLVFASNFPIRLTTADDALAQRCLELPFPNAIPAQCRDRFLKAKLLQERPGILYKALLAYRRLVQNNYIFTLDDVISPSILVSSRSTATPREDLSAFLQAACVLDPQMRVTTKDLFHRYNQLHQDYNWRAFKDERDFGFHLSSLIAEVCPQVEKGKFRPFKNENAVNGYIGMGLRD